MGHRRGHLARVRSVQALLGRAHRRHPDLRGHLDDPRRDPRRSARCWSHRSDLGRRASRARRRPGDRSVHRRVFPSRFVESVHRRGARRRSASRRALQRRQSHVLDLGDAAFDGPRDRDRPHLARHSRNHPRARSCVFDLLRGRREHGSHRRHEGELERDERIEAEALPLRPRESPHRHRRRHRVLHRHHSCGRDARGRQCHHLRSHQRTRHDAFGLRSERRRRWICSGRSGRRIRRTSCRWIRRTSRWWLRRASAGRWLRRASARWRWLRRTSARRRWLRRTARRRWRRTADLQVVVEVTAAAEHLRAGVVTADLPVADFLRAVAAHLRVAAATAGLPATEFSEPRSCWRRALARPGAAARVACASPTKLPPAEIARLREPEATSGFSALRAAAARDRSLGPTFSPRARSVSSGARVAGLYSPQS